MVSIQRLLDHALRSGSHVRPRFVHDSGPETNGSADRTWAVPLDVATKGEDTIVRASLPGVAPEDIQVSIEDRVLTIKGQTDEKFEDSDGQFVMRERRSGTFTRPCGCRTRWTRTRCNRIMSTAS